MRTNVRVIQQMEAAECGVACLAMVLDYHGHATSLPELRGICGSSRNGQTALELLTHGRRLGLTGRGMSAQLEGLAEIQTPAILHWNFNHFVVLERVGRHGITIVDPVDGRRKVSFDDASQQFSGVVLELAPGPNLEKRKRSSIPMHRYTAVLKDHRKALAFVVLANVVQDVLAVGLPATNQILIDHVIQPSRVGWLLPVMAALCVATLVQVVLQYMQGYSQTVLHSSLGMALSLEMGSHLLRLPIPFLESRGHGDLIARVNMQGELRGLLTQTVQAVFDLFLVALLISLMLAYNPFLGTISLALACLRIALVRWARRPLSQRVAAELAASGREAGALAEATSAIEMTKGFGVETQFKDRYTGKVRERVRWSAGTNRLEAALGQAMAVVNALVLATILWFGGRLVISGDMTIGVFAGFLTIRSMVEAPMASLVSLVENWFRVRGILERCDDVLGVAPIPEPVARETRAIAGQIEVQNLGFRFGHGPWILRHVNLTIKAGEHLAIVGPSGRGKSTLLKLMCGLLEPTEGRVLIDGRKVQAHGHAALARYCGVVLQEPLILEGTVHDALVIRNPDCTDRAVREAASVACFDEVVKKLSHGYESKLKPMGRNLSGGERQRLAIAQAVLERPTLLLLDEGTCSLDRALEQRVMDNLLALNATIISVAHRQSVVGRADRTFSLGPLPADGTSAAGHSERDDIQSEVRAVGYQSAGEVAVATL